MPNRFWIWYPGDFELYHGMAQNFSRVERGFGWPAFFKSEGFRNRVVFRRSYDLARETAFAVRSDAVGYVLVGDDKYPFGTEIRVPAGRADISIHAGRIDAFPSVYIEGEIIFSDQNWMVEDYDGPALPAGTCKYYARPEQDPTRIAYAERVYAPTRVEPVDGGTLYEFETELTAALRVTCPPERMGDVLVCCGESREEALNPAHCYYSWRPDPETGLCPRCAVRYAFIPGPPVELCAIHQFVDIPVKAAFCCDDELLNRIWAVSQHTFRLCSGLFFIDGVKRDKWLWAGDAYQSLFVSRYLLADKDIEQRTLLALRGNTHMTTHINTIVDYSLLWLLGVWEHHKSYGDRAFLSAIAPKARALVDFCRGRTDEHGFILGQARDWVFIDWAELDKDGPVGAEQMLLCACYDAMASIARELGEDDGDFCAARDRLAQNIDRFYWDETQGAYIDSFTSGRRLVTRQTNIFAVLFGVADDDKREKIVQNVLLGDRVPPITTPYFNFFQLDALASQGHLEPVMAALRDYWGGMLARGAVTFWEAFDPTITGPAQYAMYGDPFGKSLCHAWAASPIYLLSRYFVGLRREKDGYVLSPQLNHFGRLTCTLPLGAEGSVSISWDREHLEARADGAAVTLELCGKRYPLTETPLRLSLGR